MALLSAQEELPIQALHRAVSLLALALPVVVAHLPGVAAARPLVVDVVGEGEVDLPHEVGQADNHEVDHPLKTALSEEAAEDLCACPAPNPCPHSLPNQRPRLWRPRP